MNNKETIRFLEKMSNETTRFSREERSALLQAISAIKMQIPKKPDLEGDGYDDKGELVCDTGYCPYCRQDYEVYYHTPKYCENCGQALDWGDTE